MPRRTRKTFTRKQSTRPLLISLIVLCGLFAFAQNKLGNHNGSLLPSDNELVRVNDGDTLSLRTSSGEMLTVRLYGIDSPELHQAGGKAARSYTSELAMLKTVRLTVIYTDQYGRKVVLVHLPDGKILNRELVAAGQAWVYTNYCHEDFCAEWELLQQQARAEKKGLWGGENPQAPWKWRKQHH